MIPRRLQILIFLFVLAGLSACRQDQRHFQEADALLQQGLEYRAAKNTEAAAECFSQALVAINQCDADNPEAQRLKAQVEDNLGAMYWKHSLFDEALTLHFDAVTLLRQLNAPSLLMKALRNCGRVSASLQRTDEAQAYYGESMQLAKSQNDTVFYNELLMETSHDLYLENGDFSKAIENASGALEGGADAGFCNLVIGLSYYYLDENDTALIYLSEAVQSEKPSVRMSACQVMYLIHQSKGDFEQALRYHELYNENMMLDDQMFRSEQMERIKGEYELQLQKNSLEAKQRQKTFFLYLILGGLLAYLFVVLLLLRQKTLAARLKSEEIKNQLESALKKNKVYVTALALAEQITANTLDFHLEDADWDDFVSLVDKLHGGFTERLLAQYPTLTQTDLQICCLTKQGFSNQVISILMNIQTASFARRKSRIKQEKMNGLNDDRSFEEIINQII